MAVYRKNPFSWRRARWLAPIVLALLVVAHAQTTQPPFALFQQATLTGSGNTINATHIPVVTASGVTVYVNLAMQFNVDANGNLTLSSGFPQVTPFPAPLTSGFVAGKYAGPSTVLNGKALVSVSGPGVTDGGATEWSLSAPTGADPNTQPSSATWYVGPLASSPLAARLKSAGITSTAWSYGVGGSQNPGNGYWRANTLMGVSQVGNTLTIVSFSNGGGDLNIPTDQITYTLVP